MSAAWSTPGRAQNIQSYFPSGTAGYDQQLGVTVLSRLRPLYEPEGIRVGGFMVFPRADQSLFYNSNVTGNPGSDSFGSRTSASIAAGSDWVRNSLNASASVDRHQFFSSKIDGYTDWNVGVAGGYTIGKSQLMLAYSHQSYTQLGTNIGEIPSETAVADQIDSVRTNYTFNFGRIAITPDVSATAYRFGTATVLGVPFSQEFLDRNVIAGGVTGRFSMSDQGGLLVAVRAVSSDFINPQPGQPSNDSTSFLLLGGIDFQPQGVWRYRLLIGLESRIFAFSQFKTHTAPIIEGSVIWTPSGVTTVTGVISRAIEDPQSAGTHGYDLTQARVVVDREVTRNLFLQARGGIQFAQYLQAGTQTNLTIGGGATWLLNRSMRLSLDYDFTAQTGASHPETVSNLGTLTSGQYNRSFLALTLHLAL
jgi:hypothetical protein